MLELPIDSPDGHPIAIMTAKNEQMGAYDLQVFVGNFKTEKEAMKYAEKIKEFLEENANAQIGRVQ